VLRSEVDDMLDAALESMQKDLKKKFDKLRESLKKKATADFDE
jgi:hypothetical protein